MLNQWLQLYFQFALSKDRKRQSLDQYLLVLDQAIEDRNIDRKEADELSLLAIDCGLSVLQVSEVNHVYVRQLISHILSDGLVTESERSDLVRVARLLGISDELVAEWLKDESPVGGLPKEDLSGKTVCFSGESRCYVKGKRIDKEGAARMAETAGLRPVANVTKKLDILVVADPDTLSGKARKARQYGTRIIAERAFWYKLGYDVD
jgi:DNA polymerase-3 subunit epsilon